MRLKLLLEYDGSSFVGWQAQAKGETVQQTLEAAIHTYATSLAKSAGVELPIDKIGVVASGRTDAGVHALGQVAHLDWPDELQVSAVAIRRALNGITPESIAVLDVKQVSSDFHARFSSHLKCYRYTIVLRHADERSPLHRGWYVGESLDLAAMVSDARFFEGTHEFKSFRASDCEADSTIRTVFSSEFTRESEYRFVYHIVGKGFLKQMVRRIAGVLVARGLGLIDSIHIKKMLQGSPPPRQIKTAPADALTLAWVRY